MNMGQSISIKGELSGAEDLTLDGQVAGKISLPDNVLTVGKTARIDAEVTAKAVIVLGQLVGNVTVKDKFELLAGGSMQGNVKAPRIAMADGAMFNGKVEMPGGSRRPRWCRHLRRNPRWSRSEDREHNPKAGIEPSETHEGAA